jgi:NAD(P)-dependent dehydrogenase (short-subunit alcohol dehydrogenase family)
MSKVWLITGCSTGFGRELASHALKAGHKVVVTARKIEDG